MVLRTQKVELKDTDEVWKFGGLEVRDGICLREGFVRVVNLVHLVVVSGTGELKETT